MTMIQWILLLLIHKTRSELSKPNIVFVMSDDVGYADVSFTEKIFEKNEHLIRTPRLDELASKGTILANHYSHSTCTPSRASFLTGRYAGNTGLNFAMLPGSVAGIPKGMETLPSILRRKGLYRAHQVGKHHVGHAQWRQTPVGLGFETHVGSLLWSMEYFRKGLWELPWDHFSLDWIRAFENGTYHHYAEPRHTTEALTEEAIEVMKRHVMSDEKKTRQPLFLYVAYTAAHAPLEPLQRDLHKCGHLSHSRRRHFCGLMVGLDRNVDRLAEESERILGSNTIFIFSSDNGGAVFFGGLNAPLRSGKTMPFEGGVRVPTFALDFQQQNKRIQRGKVFSGLSHVSDWMPTVCSFAGIHDVPNDLDGHDLSEVLRTSTNTSPRNEVLLEMYYGLTKGESLFPEDLVSIRVGKWKLIQSKGGMRDSNWYYERQDGYDRMNSSDTSLATFLSNAFLDTMESFWETESRFDTIRDLAVHLGIHAWFRSNPCPETMLFDLVADPEERHDISSSNPKIVRKLENRLKDIAAKRPPQAKYWMTVDRDVVWPSTLVHGDCNMNSHVKHDDHCVFAHPWIPDDVDLETVELVFGASAVPFIKKIALRIWDVFLKPVFFVLAVAWVLPGLVLRRML